MNAHLFKSDDGNLYDTRRADWSTAAPLRRGFCKSFARIESAAEFKATLRAGGFAWPGGYPLYFVMAVGEALSFESARENVREILAAFAPGGDRDWRPVACEVNYENADLYCAHSGAKIDSAYGED